MKKGFASEPQQKKSKLWTGWRENAPAFRDREVEVLPALTQQLLQATQLLEHGNRHDGVRSGFGEAWAVAEGSMAIQAV